jgi:stage II sporulation protein D
MALEEYVLASVLSEITPAGDDARAARVIFGVQAIVARTYAIANRRRHAADGFDVCDTTHCQIVEVDRVQRSRWAALAREVVEDTRGDVLWFADKPASALFHADCGGVRASAGEVWGGLAPAYLEGGEDPLPAGREHLTWRFVVHRDELRAVLNAQPRTQVGGRLDTIDVQRRDPSGRAALVVLNGERAPLVRGEEFRSIVSRRLGVRTLRSSRFDVRREGERFVFDGRGFGHGVGLCQRGAIARAAAGASVNEILAFYFPGTAVR